MPEVFAEHFTNTLSAEDIESINAMLDHVKSLDLKIHTVLRQVRNRNFSLAIEVTNSLAYYKGHSKSAGRGVRIFVLLFLLLC